MSQTIEFNELKYRRKKILWKNKDFLLQCQQHVLHMQFQKIDRIWIVKVFLFYKSSIVSTFTYSEFNLKEN